jgi:cell division septal protein FtsQ
MMRMRRSSDSAGDSMGRRSRRTKEAKADKSARPVKFKENRYEERSAPPVLIRGADLEGLSWQTKPRGKSKPRRRYDVALSMPGVEMRLPSLPQVAFGWRMMSFLIVVALGALLYYLWSSPQYHVQAAQITGLQRISTQDVNAVLNVNGESIFTVSDEELRKRLQQAFPEFSSLEVHVALPGEVTVKIEERQPILVWRQDGRTILVDANGVSFPMRDQNVPLPPVIVDAHGSPPAQNMEINDKALEQFMPVEMVSAILSMSAQAPKNTPIMFDPQRGLGWKDAQGWEVYFGDMSNMDIKLRLYKAILNKLDEEDTMPALISVEHVHLPYYRLER